MNTSLSKILESARQLPEIDQEELAAQIDDMITQRLIARGEASYAKDGGVPLDKAFDQIINNLTEQYGK